MIPYAVEIVDKTANETNGCGNLDHETLGLRLGEYTAILHIGVLLPGV